MPALKMLEENIAEAIGKGYECLAAMTRATFMKRWRRLVKRWRPKRRNPSSGRTRSARWRAGSRRTGRLARAGRRRGGRI